MGQIIKFQHEVFNGQLVNSLPDYDILYPKTSADQVDNLTEFVQALIESLPDTKVKSVTFSDGTSSEGPTLTVTLADGTSVTSKSINIATTEKHGVTILTNDLDSESEKMAATAKAVRTVYDNLTKAITSLKEELEYKCLKTETFDELNILNKVTPLKISEAITEDTLVNVIAYNYEKGKGVVIINEGVTFSIKEGTLYVNSTAKTVNRVKVVYEYSFK